MAAAVERSGARINEQYSMEFEFREIVLLGSPVVKLEQSERVQIQKRVVYSRLGAQK